MARVSAKEWNQGLVGPPKPGRVVQRPGGCTTDGCGQEYTGTTPRGMQHVHVEGSTEPARVYCPGFCAKYGRALAELRALPIQGGDADG